jgi:hypothetical protein
MQVNELARELGVNTKKVMTFLKKEHHLASVSDQEANLARIAMNDGGLIVSTDAKPVKFWSKNRDQMVARPDGTTIRFTNYIYVCEVGDGDDIILSRIPHPDIVKVCDKPYEDEGKAVQFRNDLRSIVFTGSMGEVSRDRGMTAITSIFWREELDALKDKMWNPDVLIERAVRTKSFSKGD